MLNTKSSALHQTKRLILAISLPTLITACGSSEQSLLDIGSIFPDGVLPATNPEVTNTEESLPGENTGPTDIPPTEEPVSIPPTGEETNASILPELEILTRGQLRFESLFNGTTEPILDNFMFTAEDYDYFPDEEFGALTSVSTSGDTLSICAYINETNQHLCLRSFDEGAGGRVWHLFSLQTETSGSGFFEFCSESVSDDECSTKLFNQPDGTDSVTITPLNASTSLPNASPYFAYSEQSTVNRNANNVVVGEHYVNTMRVLSTAVSESTVED